MLEAHKYKKKKLTILAWDSFKVYLFQIECTKQHSEEGMKIVERLDKSWK